MGWLRREYVRAYDRQRYGPWWSWRRWFKRVRPAYKAAVLEAFEAAAPWDPLGHLPEARVTWHREDDDTEDLAARALEAGRRPATPEERRRIETLLGALDEDLPPIPLEPDGTAFFGSPVSMKRLRWNPTGPGLEVYSMTKGRWVPLEELGP